MSPIMNSLVTVLMVVCTVASCTNGLPAAKINSGDTNGYCESCVCGVRGRGNRIVGGHETNAHEFPWLAAVSRQGTIACGATLISHHFVLTAAHCVYGLEPEELVIYLGGHNVSSDYTELRRIRAIHIHEGFDIISFDSDIALLRLDRPVYYGPNVQPACLPDPAHQTYDGDMTVVAGWGRTGESLPVSSVLRSLIVPVWSHSQCSMSEYGRDRITNNMLCAGFHDGQRDACKGDSGGPMHREGDSGSMEVIGLVSFGRGCARPNLPGIYTKVVNFLPWIQKKMGRDCMCRPRFGVRTNYVEQLYAKHG